MRLADIAVRLAELHDNPGYRVERFDDGPSLSGRVAVLPSAFNPPTVAHLDLLGLATGVEGVESAAAMLTTNNVDKSLFGAPLSHRVGMLLAVQKERPSLAILGSNAARLLDQGEALRIGFPGTAFDFLVGYDTLVRVFDPKYYENMSKALERFFANHRLIATNRAPATLEAIAAYLEVPVVRDYRQRIVIRELPAERATVSSTRVRESASKGAAPEAVTPEVARYIRDHGLYGEP